MRSKLLNAMPRKPRGFTLPEILIAMSIMVVLMVAATMAIYAAQTAHAYNLQKTELVSRARGVLDRIARDVRRCAEFEVPVPSTLAIALPDGMTHTYAWDGAPGGPITYVETDLGGVTTNSVVLTGNVQTFFVTDVSPSCQIHIVLAGDRATSEASITATPRKALF